MSVSSDAQMDFTYDEAKMFAIEHLAKAVAANLAGDFEKISDGYQEFEMRIPRTSDPREGKLHTALIFWDRWVYASHHGMRYSETREYDWPKLASIIIASLNEDREITHSVIVEAFSPKPGGPPASIFSRIYAKIFGLDNREQGREEEHR